MLTNKQRRQVRSAIEIIRKQLVKVNDIEFEDHDEITSMFANVSGACEVVESELNKLDGEWLDWKALTFGVEVEVGKLLHHPKCELSPHVFPDGRHNPSATMIAP